MVTHPYEVSGRDIERLSDVELLDLLNRLLLAEVNKLAVSPTAVQTNLRKTDPDGGVDAKTDLPKQQRGRWIPPGACAWQYKSGRIRVAEILKEVSKPGVQRILREGGTYLLVSGSDYGAKARQSREDELTKNLSRKRHHRGTKRRRVSRGQKSQSRRWRFMTSTDIATWVNEHPGLLSLPYFQRPVGDFLRIEDVRRQTQHQIPFVEDENRRQLISAVREATRNARPAHLRIEGKAGAGKTRAVAEALNHPGLAERVLWFTGPDKIPPGLMKWLRDSAATAVVVVDECPLADAEKLAPFAEASNERVILISVDQVVHSGSALGSVEGRIDVALLSDEKIGEIVRRVGPAIHPEAQDLIVRVSGGYVKLAAALALATATRPTSQSLVGLTRDRAVQVLLAQLLSDKERDGMRALAMLNRVGWEKEVAAEGKAIATFFRLDWGDLQDLAKRMVDRGLVATRGRYRYVTPHILAVWLAADVWEARGEAMFDLLELLPSGESRQAMFERLLDLGEVSGAQPVIQKLLSQEGPFKSLDDVDDETRGRLLGLLTTALPEAGIAALKRLVEPLPRERLQEFKIERRRLVWTLEKLAWLPETFRDAARLLLRLADAENETFANSATGIWTGLFKTYLGGTAVPALQRHELIAEALRADSTSVRLLGVKAIEAALETHESRIGGAEQQGGRVLPPEWRPRTRAEDIAVRRSALALLDRALNDSNTEIRAAGMDVLLRAIRRLVSFGMADEVLARLTAAPLSEPERGKAVKEVKAVLRYDRQRLPASEVSSLENLAQQLEGTELTSRLRMVVGPEGDWDVVGEDSSERQRLRAIVQQLLSQPSVLDGQLDWLTSSEPRFSGVFGSELGAADIEVSWLPQLVRRSNAPQGAFVLSSYLVRVAGHKGRQWLDQLLDEWAASKPELALAVLETSWRTEANARAAVRILDLIDRGWLQPTQLSGLGYGGWTSRLPISEFKAIVRRLLGVFDDSVVDHVGFMLLTWVEAHREQAPEIRDIVWQFFDLSLPIKSDRHASRMHYIAELTKIFAHEDPKRLTRAILRRIREHGEVLLPSDPLIEILRTATSADPAGTWQLVGEELLHKDDTAYRLSMALEEHYVTILPNEMLLEWARANRPDGPRLVANLAPVTAAPLDVLARTLLITYGEMDSSIGSALFANYWQGTFSGPESARLSGKLEIARKWLDDPHSAVRAWAQRVVDDLSRDLARAKLQEDERGW